MHENPSRVATTKPDDASQKRTRTGYRSRWRAPQTTPRLDPRAACMRVRDRRMLTGSGSSELLERCRQPFHPEELLLLVAVGKAEEEPSPRQWFQTVPGERGDLDARRRCQVCGPAVIFVRR